MSSSSDSFSATPADALARAQALDTNFSFVVQAPAGSGKTTLLTQRILALLARCAEPEAVLAITFTRKAAAEMRERVLSALHQAAANAPVDGVVQVTTRALALQVLSVDATHGWNLLQNPARLKVQTIDSLCHWLAARLPILSRTGASLRVASDAKDLYRLAAQRTIGEIESRDALAVALMVLLRHFDAEVDRVESLLADMLARRESWLEITTSIHAQSSETVLREMLEDSIEYLVQERLIKTRALLPEQLASRLWPLSAQAALLAPTQTPGTAQLGAIDATGLSGRAEQLPAWKTLAWQLLTRQGEYRKKLTKTEGFPASTALKKEFDELLGELRELPGLESGLAAVAALPAVGYSDEQWQVLLALNTVLTAAAAQLSAVFAEQGQVDFSAVTHAALQALGTDEEPSDLTLALDYKFQHILVDEFQDTSRPQVQLLTRLTAGWQSGDGRTLFLVGDPMQSIYAFRQADVGLFLKVRNLGLGSIELRPLLLTANFRSRPTLVEWVNRAFARVFPSQEDYSRGAIRHSPATAVRAHAANSGATLRLLKDADLTAEAQEAATLIESLLQEQPRRSIAVLARSRRPLTTLAQALQARSIRYQGVDLVPLVERLAVRDVIALTRAVLHRGDRTAWLAVLHAPFIGLDLESFWHVCAGDPDATVWSLLHDEAALEGLSHAARLVLGRVMPVLERTLADVGRRPLAELVEATWLSLGGPATVQRAEDLQNVATYFARLDTLERAGDLPDPAGLEEALGELYALPDAEGDPNLQLLTVHRAKGLEWDVVIVLGLGRTTRRQGTELLQRLEYARVGRDSSLVLAPHRAGAETKEPLESWVKGILAERAELELARLLYVACTRAREALHLIGHVTSSKEGVLPQHAPPQRGTLLSSLWTAIAEDVDRGVIVLQTAPSANSAAVFSAIAENPLAGAECLSPEWVPPPVRASIIDLIDLPRPAGPSEFDFEWAGFSARHVGTVVHAEFEYISNISLDRYDIHKQARTRVWTTRLQELGVPGAQLATTLERVRRAVLATLDDKRGRWLFASTHREAASEVELSYLRQNRLITLRIDRTFIAEDGTRWIIDYKTSEHQGSDLADFLAQEQLRYAEQLGSYAQAMRLLEPTRPIKLGLYFPMHSAWLEWPANASTAS
jgi:ATP-dependent exoDNAse (exonuclease V) beta subunit